MESSAIRVLLIEDDLGDALLVTRRLERELGSLETVTLDRANTLEEGIDRLGKKSTDVVLLDLHLPDSAGTDTIRRLREADSHVPIVVLTSAGEGDVPVRALKAGAQDYLGKGDFETGPLVHRTLRYAIERVRMQEEKRQLQSQVHEAERLQSLGVLGTGAAFGFNQLIGAILDHIDEALADLATAPEFARGHVHLLEARQAALRATELTEQLRDYGRTGDRSSTAPLDLSASVRADRAQLEAIAGPQIEIEFDLDESGPTARVDPLDVHQLLLNLVINASEAIRPNAGRIRIETGTLWADPELLAQGRGALHLTEGAYCCLTVSDSGPGLDGRTASRIFDPFFTTKFAGRGLGLAAALGIVRRNGGWISAGNGPSGGARFQVLLPVAA